jgi:predicted CXXCH cytochrome family protein
MLPALLLAGGLLLGGCSPVARYRVLSFFFDDVPPPPGLPPEMVRQSPGGPTPWGTEATAQAPATAQQTAAAAPATPPVFYHPPYRLRECTACHASESSYQPPASEIDACGKCHADHVDWRPDDWVHGPVALGRCTLCHEPHKGQYAKLLTAPQPDICFHCHSKDRVLAQTYHQQGDVTDCSACHDPHSAGNRLLLADSETYARGSPALLEEPKGHASWGKDRCATCHLATQSNALVKDVDQKCLGCHNTKDLAPAGQTLHAPVALGRCTTCHTPHRSPLPHLVKPQAEKICYTCHKPDELRSPPHPEVARANCLICHRGHYSDLPHLLRPGIPAAG